MLNSDYCVVNAVMKPDLLSEGPVPALSELCQTVFSGIGDFEDGFLLWRDILFEVTITNEIAMKENTSCPSCPTLDYI